MKTFKQLVDETVQGQMAMGHGFVKNGEKRKNERRKEKIKDKNKSMRKETRRKSSY